MEENYQFKIYLYGISFDIKAKYTYTHGSLEKGETPNEEVDFSIFRNDEDVCHVFDAIDALYPQFDIWESINDMVFKYIHNEQINPEANSRPSLSHPSKEVYEPDYNGEAILTHIINGINRYI